jgi:hypothetical protein
MTQEQTTQEALFLDYLFDGNTIRHPNEAKVLAGYAPDYPWLKIVEKAKEKLIEKYDAYLAFMASRGMMGLVDVMDNPHVPGSAVKLKAIIEILDRGGVTKKDSKEALTASPNYVFVLPAKNQINE